MNRSPSVTNRNDDRRAARQRRARRARARRDLGPAAGARRRHREHRCATRSSSDACDRDRARLHDDPVRRRDGRSRCCCSCSWRTCSSTSTSGAPCATRSTKACAPPCPASASPADCEARAREVVRSIAGGSLLRVDELAVRREGELIVARARDLAAVVVADGRARLAPAPARGRARRAVSTTRRSERGFVAIEWVAAVGVAAAADRRARRDAAGVGRAPARGDGRGARSRAACWSATGRTAIPIDASVVAREVAADHGVDASDVERARVVGRRGARRRRRASRSTSTMPAISVLGMRAGAWHYTAVEVRRIDDYRSR